MIHPGNLFSEHSRSSARRAGLCRRLFLIIAVVTVCRCSSEEPYFKKLNLPSQGETAHFIFYADNNFDPFTLQSVKAKLEAEHALIIEHLQPANMTKVKVALWSDAEAFGEAQNNRFPGSSGYVVSKNEIRILYSGTHTGQIAVHEFVHAVTLFVDDDFANNPRWLWEAIAIYEADDFIEPSTIPYLVNGNFPSLPELNGDFNKGNQQIYQVGYTLGEFIVSRWGYGNLRTLITNHGNIENALGITTADFETQWREFVTTKYL
jgi:hypothetical protein